MTRIPFQLGKLILALLAIAAIAGCGQGAPSPDSPLPTPSATSQTSPVSASALPTPAVAAGQEKILLHVRPKDSPTKGQLVFSNPDGSGREVWAQAAPTLGSVAVSPNKAYVAYFTSDTANDGALMVRDSRNGATLLEIPVPAEVSYSFRDAAATRALAWSPDGETLAAVMNRDLHLVDLDEKDVGLLVPHREGQYNLAGRVMGTVQRPVWSSDGSVIVYDAFSPPDILTADADETRDVERVEISGGVPTLLLEDANIVGHAVAPDRGSVILRDDEGQSILLNLDTLRMEKTSSLLESRNLSPCSSQSERCAWILSEQRENDLLRIKIDPQTEPQDLRVSELEGAASDCQFQSILWHPDGGTLLTTVGCAGGVSLLSLEGPELDSTHLANWTDVDAAGLLSWFN